MARFGGADVTLKRATVAARASAQNKKAKELAYEP